MEGNWQSVDISQCAKGYHMCFRKLIMNWRRVIGYSFRSTGSNKNFFLLSQDRRECGGYLKAEQRGLGL